MNAPGELRVIWKYPFPVCDTFRQDMPKGSEVLSIQVQDGNPVMWVLCDPLQFNASYMFNIFGTGKTFAKELFAGGHVGTFQLNGFVWHVFKVEQ